MWAPCLLQHDLGSLRRFQASSVCDRCRNLSLSGHSRRNVFPEKEILLAMAHNILLKITTHVARMGYGRYYVMKSQ